MEKANGHIYWENMMQIRHSSILLYSLPTVPLTHKRNALNYSTYSGQVTKDAAKRIRRAVDMLLQIAKPELVFNPVINRQIMHTLSFITLTISAKERHLTASEGHKLLLAPWLLRMKRKAGMTTYIWKAEFQKNGQLHYHITTPSFIHYSLIRDEWNNILSKAGMLSGWCGLDGRQPNSTDVHAVYKIKNMQAYLTKYIAKGNKDVIEFFKKHKPEPAPDQIKSPVQVSNSSAKSKAKFLQEYKKLPVYKITVGKIWDCSTNIKKNKPFSCPAPPNWSFVDKEATVKELERCTVINHKAPLSITPFPIRKLYSTYIDHVRKSEVLEPQ